jgi:hypothetical protein
MFMKTSSITENAKKVVLYSSAIFCFSCSTSKYLQLPSIIPIDIFALSGQGPVAQNGCPDQQLYRYVARTNGPKARMDDFCIHEEYQEEFVHQPPNDMLEDCPSEFCGMTSTAHRFPIEYALLQSAVSLERIQKVKVGTKEITFDDGIQSEDISLYFETVRFELSPGVSCISKLEEYEEHHGRNTLPQVEHILALERMQRGEREYIYQGTSLVSGSIFMEQTKKDSQYSVLVIVESKYEEAEDAGVWTEKTLCKSKLGPIFLRGSENFNFHVQSINQEEWSINSSWNTVDIDKTNR